MDAWICQTSTASPAEPGGLSCWASCLECSLKTKGFFTFGLACQTTSLHSQPEETIHGQPRPHSRPKTPNRHFGMGRGSSKAACSTVRNLDGAAL